MKRWIAVAIIVSLCLNINTWPLTNISRAAPPDHTSSGFGIDEYFIGSGGEIDATSASYSLRGSIGDIGIGNSASANYQIYGGYTTTREEFIEFAVNTTDVDLGVLSESTTGTGTATFQIRNYLSEGYVVKHYGNTLTNQDGYEIPAMASQAASSQGTEQFGINLRANTDPASFGADVQQVPDATFSFGAVDSEYGTVDQYKFVSGETIASSPTSSGQSVFTIAYIANIQPTTGAGNYTMGHNVVVTSTF